MGWDPIAVALRVMMMVAGSGDPIEGEEAGEGERRRAREQQVVGW